MFKSVGMPEFYQDAKRQTLPIVDVREVDEFAAGHVPNAQNIPLSQLAERFDELDQTKPYYIICQSGGRSATACQFLGGKGYDVTNVLGGTGGWPGALE